jgi:Spy/CpxP family protein refolding chaperone
MKLKRFTFSFCFSLLLLASSSFSQPSGMRHGPGMGMREWKGEEYNARASELNLSPDQTKDLSRIQQTYFRETQLLRAELLLKRLELGEFLTNPAMKMESIRAKHLETVEIQSKLEEKEIEYLIKVRNLLTQEQLKSWDPEQEFSSSRRMMHGPGHMGPMHFRGMPPPTERFGD